MLCVGTEKSGALAKKNMKKIRLFHIINQRRQYRIQVSRIFNVRWEIHSSFYNFRGALERKKNQINRTM